MYFLFSSTRSFGFIRCTMVAEELELAGPGAVQHPRMLSSVDFPAPDGPMMVTNSPSLISTLMRRST